MKMECPTYKKKMEKLENKFLKETKAYITWEENERAGRRNKEKYWDRKKGGN